MLLVGTVSTFLPPWFCKIIKNSYHIDMKIRVYHFIKFIQLNMLAYSKKSYISLHLSRIKDANKILNFEQEEFLRGFMYRVQIEEWILVNSKNEDKMDAKNGDAMQLHLTTKKRRCQNFFRHNIFRRLIVPNKLVCFCFMI